MYSWPQAGLPPEIRAASIAAGSAAAQRLGGPHDCAGRVVDALIEQAATADGLTRIARKVPPPDRGQPLARIHRRCTLDWLLKRGHRTGRGSSLSSSFSECGVRVPKVPDLAVSLDDSGCRRGLLLIVLCRFSAVVADWRLAVVPDVLGTAPAPTAPGWPPSGSRGRGWLVSRVRAGRTAAASRPGRRPSRARCG